MNRTPRLIRFSTAVVLVIAVAACGGAARSGDDVARIVNLTNQSRRSVSVVLDDAARASTRNSDDLARILASAEAPPDAAIVNATGGLRVSGIADSAATGIVCDVLADIAIDPDGVTRDDVAAMVVSNLVAALGGTTLGWSLTAGDIADDIASGRADSALWARATLLKLRHCS